MRLSTEELDPIDDVTQEAVREILESDVFGKFAILAESTTSFIQAASDWQPTEECGQFLRQNASDPWIREYRDGTSNTQFRASRYVTLNEVIDAFLRYLIHDDSWRRNFNWRIADD